MRRNIINKNIPRLLALLLAMTLLFAAAPVAMAAESGSCGDNLTWAFADGKLTISGSGVMYNYTEHSMAPWSVFRDQIIWLSLPEGLTHVGNMAFYKCENLESVAMPSTVTSIGELAFSQNRSMTMLSLNHGLRTIGRSAFESCESLQDVYIPGSVVSIGNRAFFLCETLRYVTVPSSVTDMGSSVFGYCGNLLGADVDAAVNTLPSGTFLGCDNLQNVEFGGSPVNVAVVKQGGNGNTGSSEAPVIPQPVQPQSPVPVQPQNPDLPVSGNQMPTGSASSAVIPEGENGEKIQVSTTTQNDNSTINSDKSITADESGFTTETAITATVRDPEGWNDVVTEIKEAEKGGNSSNTVDVTVFVTNDPEVPKEVVEELAGKNVVLNVQTQTGSKYKVICKDIKSTEVETGMDFSYTITTAEDVPEEFAGLKVYSLKFAGTVKINAEVMIRLPNEIPRRSAALYQLESGKPVHLVSAVVDDESYAHFYLSSVDEKTEYLIAMDVPGAVSTQAIIPENLYDEYTLVDQATGKAYVVTGRSSSWGMGLGKVMTILAVVMVSMIVIVGFVMYAWNKRRLKMGYVPDLDEEDYM